MDINNVSRVIQGIAAGIGFLGAGTILKLSDVHEIKGLTTAASIWMTAAIGVAIGAGRIGLALLSVVLGLIILYVLHQVEHWCGLSTGTARQDAHKHNGPRS
jgi:putative Mg2+ transporter-C (MgtC) family protein